MWWAVCNAHIDLELSLLALFRRLRHDARKIKAGEGEKLRLRFWVFFCRDKLVDFAQTHQQRFIKRRNRTRRGSAAIAR
jgi:hypothetical protein